MLPATRPYQACYSKPVGVTAKSTRKPVVAWSDKGEAMVVDLEAGELMKAVDLEGFIGLREGDDEW